MSQLDDIKNRCVVRVVIVAEYMVFALFVAAGKLHAVYKDWVTGPKQIPNRSTPLNCVVIRQCKHFNIGFPNSFKQLRRRIRSVGDCRMHVQINSHHLKIQFPLIFCHRLRISVQFRRFRSSWSGAVPETPYTSP